MGRLRRLYGKIVEVISEACGGYIGKPLDPLGPCRPTPGAPGTMNWNQGQTFLGKFVFVYTTSGCDGCDKYHNAHSLSTTSSSSPMMMMRTCSKEVCVNT